MKLKKISYVIVLILTLALGINKTYAGSEKCNYIAENGEFKAQLKMKWGYDNGINFRTLNDYANVKVIKTPLKALDANDEHINNWWKAGLNNWYDQCTKGGGVCFDPYYENEKAANNDSDPHCPEYLVFQKCTLYCVWGTDSESEAQNAVSDIKNSGCTGIYATYKNEAGEKYTPEELFSEYQYDAELNFDPDGNIECNEFFGDKDDEDSIAYMIHHVMQYVRIGVPILIILLGTIDLAKAVLASKEDTIKKAQMDLVKRIIMGVAIFFVPLFVDVIMELADIVWQGGYSFCDFNF